MSPPQHDFMLSKALLEVGLMVYISVKPLKALLLCALFQVYFKINFSYTKCNASNQVWVTSIFNKEVVIYGTQRLTATC